MYNLYSPFDFVFSSNTTWQCSRTIEVFVFMVLQSPVSVVHKVTIRVEFFRHVYPETLHKILLLNGISF